MTIRIQTGTEPRIKRHCETVIVAKEASDVEVYDQLVELRYQKRIPSEATLRRDELIHNNAVQYSYIWWAIEL